MHLTSAIQISLCFRFSIKNESDVALEYSWDIQPGIYRPPSVVDESSTQSKGKTSAKSTSSKSESRASRAASRKQHDVLQSDEIKGRPTSVMTSTHCDEDTTTALKRSSIDAFTIEPQRGHINASSETEFTVRFSPLKIEDLDAILMAV